MRPHRQNPRLPRLAARYLAVPLAIAGLLGHGVAMLLVSLLAGAPAAAQTDFPGFVEICTADGLTKSIATAPSSGKQKEAPGPVSGKIDACPVCSAFAQNGQADLPVQAALAVRIEGITPPRPVHQIVAARLGEQLALSRGPPAA